MISRETLLKIARYGQMAPSGDNLQDWRFSLKENSIDLIGEFFSHPFNLSHRASFPGYGAVLENMSIAAQEFGFEMIEDLFPAGGGRDLIASLRFLELAEKKPHPLFPFIEKRAVNRRNYSRKELPSQIRKELIQTAQNSGLGQLFIADVSLAKKYAAKAAFYGSQVMMERKDVHDALFNSIRWTQRDAEKTRDGLYIKTLELRIQEPAFRLLSSWGLTKALNFLGLSRFAAFQDYRLCLGSSALGLIQIPNDSPKAVLEGGKLFERFWLKLTSLGLSLQPETALIFFLYMLRDNPSQFTPSQRKCLTQGLKMLKEAFSLENERGILMFFRFGYAAQEPSARSLRKEI